MGGSQLLPKLCVAMIKDGLNGDWKFWIDEIVKIRPNQLDQIHQKDGDKSVIDHVILKNFDIIDDDIPACKNSELTEKVVLYLLEKGADKHDFEKHGFRYAKPFGWQKVIRSMGMYGISAKE